MSAVVPSPLSRAAIHPRPSFDVSETALSFANRLASFHIGLPTTDFLHDFGIAPMKLVAGEPEALDRLCEISGSEREHVYQNTPVRTGKRVYDLRGHSLPAEFFSRPRTVWSLVDFGELPVTRIQSPNAQHFVTRCHLQDVNDLGERLVNAGRIAPLLDIPATEIEAKLRRHRVKPAFRWADVGANLFHRDDVKKLFPI